MLTHIHLTNFRGFRAFQTETRAVTAFLGPNSSGKTTALQAIRFVCDALQLALASERPAKLVPEVGDHWIEVSDGGLVEYHRLVSLSNWQALFVDQAVGEGVSLTVSLCFEDEDELQEVRAQLVCARNEQLKLRVLVRSAQAVAVVEGLPKKSKNINQRLTAFVRDHAPVAVFVPPFYGAVRNEEYRTQAVVDRLLGAGDQSHVVRNLVVSLEADQFERLNGFLADTIGATLTYRTSADEVQRTPHLVVRFRDSNGEIELSAAGAGLVNLVALYTALSRWRKQSKTRRVMFLLDEPEAHLHPRLQADMTERLATLVTKEFGGQLLLATHSVDILNRLSRLGALLVRCDRTAEPSSVRLSGDAELLDDLAGWVDLTPFTAINFLASRRVVFCEGDDELALFPLLARLLFRNDPRRADRYASWALVRLHGASNTPVAALLVRLVRNELVKARAQQPGGFRVEVVLDRDHQRTPGTLQSDTDGVRETTTVWSQHSLESLLLEPRVLTTWARAFLGDEAPADLSQRVLDAVRAADGDKALNEWAIEQLVARSLCGDVIDADGRVLSGQARTVHAMRQVRAAVEQSPATWQRGKDRGRLVLGALRAGLPPRVGNQFPTDVVRLVERTDLNRIGTPGAAVPDEVRTLLERLVAE